MKKTQKTEEVFQKIASKGKSVSFKPHDAYEEQIGKRSNLGNLAGSWSKETAEEVRKAVGSFRKKFSKSARVKRELEND